MFGGKLGVPELIIILIVLLLILKAGRLGRAAFGGVLLGAIVGFLLRPSVPIVGQLPFETVITRGADLQGLDTVLRSAAERSFNYMLAGAIIGGVILAMAAGVTAKRTQQAEDTGGKKAAVAAGSAKDGSATAVNTSNSRFCSKCGERLAPESTFCGGCGNKLA